MSKSGRMMAKFEAGKDSKYGSRTERWETQYAKFKDNPIFGNGFAVNYYNGYRVIGRSETGSGWLSILFQTGLLGAAGMCIILIPLIKRKKYLKHSDKFKLIYCTFAFLFFSLYDRRVYIDCRILSLYIVLDRSRIYIDIPKVQHYIYKI